MMAGEIQKRKVLFVAHHLTVGGAQKSLVMALQSIDYEKNDVTLYVRKKRLDLLNEIDKRVTVIVNEDPTHYYRNGYAFAMLCAIHVSRLFNLRDTAKRLTDRLTERIRNRMMKYEKNRYFNNQKYDVAISYIQGYTADILAEAIEADRKYLFYHSSTDEAHEFHERVFPKFDAIIAVGDEIKSILGNLYPSYVGKIGVLYNYVDYLTVRNRATEDTINLPHDRTILCSCGRLSPVKGFDLAVEAARILKASGEVFVWYFVGDGPERSKLEGMIHEYGLEDCIIITGMQANPYPWINGCDIYVQPSYEESYGLAIFEAQILCKPVVTTATVGGKVLVQNGLNGLISEIDENSLAAGIRELMSSREKIVEMVAYLNQVDYSKSFEQYKNAWKRLLEG